MITPTLNGFLAPSAFRMYMQILTEKFHGIYRQLKDRDLGLCDSKVEFTQDQKTETSFLIGSNSGLLAYQKGSLIRLLPNPIYGITRLKNYYYALQRIGRSSRILKFTLTVTPNDNIVVSNVNIIVSGLSVGIHQIDFIGVLLFAADAYNNAISVFKEDGSLVEKIYPSGKLKYNNIFCGNYRHYNSVFCDGEVIYLIAHNNSLKTGKESEIHILNYCEHYKIIDKIKHTGLAAHNVIKLNEDLFYCDSLRSTILKNDRVILKIDKYLTRGLAIDDNYIIVGGSEFAFGKKRLTSSGCVFISDREGKILNRIFVKRSGGISEIRMLGKDYGFSSNFMPEEMKSINI